MNYWSGFIYLLSLAPATSHANEPGRTANRRVELVARS